MHPFAHGASIWALRQRKIQTVARRTDDLLDMDYFLHEDVFGEGSFGEESFYIF